MSERKTPKPEERLGNHHHGVRSNIAVFGRHYIADEEDAFDGVAISAVAQCATSLYFPCYVNGDRPNHFIKYRPEDLRLLTLAEMETMKPWFTNKRDKS